MQRLPRWAGSTEHQRASGGASSRQLRTASCWALQTGGKLSSKDSHVRQKQNSALALFQDSTT